MGVTPRSKDEIGGFFAIPGDDRPAFHVKAFQRPYDKKFVTGIVFDDEYGALSPRQWRGGLS